MLPYKLYNYSHEQANWAHFRLYALRQHEGQREMAVFNYSFRVELHPRLEPILKPQRHTWRVQDGRPDVLMISLQFSPPIADVFLNPT